MLWMGESVVVRGKWWWCWWLGIGVVVVVGVVRDGGAGDGRAGGG